MFRKNAPTFFMALIASFLMTAALSLTVYGQPLSTRTVRVGYPIQAGLTDKDADGNLSLIHIFSPWTGSGASTCSTCLTEAGS